MFPEIFKIGPIAIQTYGVLLALAFIIGISLTRKRALHAGENEENIYNLSYVIMISSIIGARLLYVLFHIDEFRGRWKYVFWPVQEDGTVGIGGLILLGGVIAAVIAAVIYIRKKKLPFLKYADLFAPALPLGIFFGRLGCFFNGCCFGKECSLPWAVVFPAHSPAGSVMGHTHIHPTQLYESFFNLGLFILILVLERFYEKYKGFSFAIFLIGYGLERFIIDFYRFYEQQMFVLGPLDFNQVISLLMLISGIFIVFFVRSMNNGYSGQK